jgi:hypothetical protein
MLSVCAALVPWVLPALIDCILHLSLGCRLLIIVPVLAPVGVLMGLPLPKGLAWLSREATGLIPWAWAINGCASVVGSVAAAIVALTWGLQMAMEAGAACYVGACLIALLRLTPKAIDL